ncbi:MAG TPA: AMP-binding protein [Acidimicrobiales bacterium]|nr:AMP-binding protein [Acidimicrobiales bacterium]
MTARHNFADIWDAVARVKDGSRAVVHGDRIVSWRELEARAAGVATALVEAGLPRQAKVAQYLYNCPEYVESVYAAYKASYVPVNTNYRYLDDELVYLWTNADVEAVVFHGSFVERIERLRDRVPAVRYWLWVDDDTGPCPAWAMPYEKAATSATSLDLPWERSPDDLLFLYTGGTTGLPKGVMWAQGDYADIYNDPLGGLLANAADVEEIARRVDRPMPVMMAATPLMHGTGLSVLHTSLLCGGTLVLLPSRSYDAEEMLDELARHRVFSVSVAGDVFMRPVLEALAREPHRWDLSSLRFISSSGAMWSAATKRDLLAHLPPVTLVDGLASTEGAAFGNSVSTADNVTETASFKLTERSTVLDDDGNPVEPGSGAVGRLCSTGSLPLGYYKDPERTAATFPVINGVRYAVTGDYATVGADGTIHLLGRGSVCINTGGEKVYPEEVEEVVKEHPAVADAVVVGVPHPRFGESVVAVVEPAEGQEVDADAVVAHAKGRLAGYKVPRSIVVVPSMERTPSGKVDYRRLKELATARLA